MSKDNRRPPMGKSVVRGLTLLLDIVNVVNSRIPGRQRIRLRLSRNPWRRRDTADMKNALEWIAKTEGWSQEGR